jgi:hypothetical protein
MFVESRLKPEVTEAERSRYSGNTNKHHGLIQKIQSEKVSLLQSKNFLSVT